MTGEVGEIRRCGSCGAAIGRMFRYCPVCSQIQPIIENVPQRAPEVSAEPVSPPMVVRGLDAPSLPVISTTSDHRVRVRAPSGDRRTRLVVIGGGILAGGLILVLATMWPRAKTPETLELRVGADRWESVDLGARLGAGRSFVVVADAPLRLRTEVGKPITTAAGPVSLGEIADGRIEVKAVSGTARISFVAR